MIPIRTFLSAIAFVGIVTSISAIANPSSLPVQDYEPMNYDETSGKVQGVKLRDGSEAPPCQIGDYRCVVVIEDSEYNKHKDLLDQLKASTGKKCSYFSGFNSESRFCIIHSVKEKIELYAKLDAAGVQYKANGGVTPLKVKGG